MRKFLKDVVSTLYASDGGMSLFRFTFFVAFVAFIGIAVADFCCLEHHFDHYSEFSIFVGTLGGIACGNKLVDIKAGGGDDG